ILLHPTSTLFPYTTLFRSDVGRVEEAEAAVVVVELADQIEPRRVVAGGVLGLPPARDVHTLRQRLLGVAQNLAVGLVERIARRLDRKSTRLNSSHQIISYA